jgi:hypothetical protein
MQQQPQPATPIIVQIETKPSEEIGVDDVLLGSIYLTGAIIVGALLVGLLVGGLFIMFRKWRDARLPDNSTEPPHTKLNLSSPS